MHHAGHFFLKMLNLGTLSYFFFFLLIPDVFYTKHNKSCQKLESLNDRQKSYRKDWVSKWRVHLTRHFWPHKTLHNFSYFNSSKVLKYFSFNKQPMHLIIKKNSRYDYIFPVFLGVWFVHHGGHFLADHKQILCLKTKQSFKLSF